MRPLKWLQDRGFFLGVNLSYFRGIGVGLVVGGLSGLMDPGMGQIAIGMGVITIFIGAWFYAEGRMKEKIKELDAEAVKPT